MPDRIPAVT